MPTSPGLNPVGVSFISQNFTEFISNMGKAGLAVLGFRQATEESIAAATTFATGLDRLNKLGVDTGAVGRKISEGFNQATKDVERSGNVLKNYVSDVFKGLFSGIKTGWKVGAIAGTIIGFIQPELMVATQVIGGLMGAFVGQFIGLASAIPKAVYDFYKSISLAIASGLGKVVKNIVQAGFSVGEAFVGFGKTVFNAIIKAIDSIGNTIKGLFDKIFGFFTGSGEAGRGGWRGLSSSILGAMVKFELLKQAVRSVINDIKDFSKASFDAAVELQTLDIRINNLIASQVRNAGITKDYNDSIGMTVGATQDLLVWTEKLALATPVSVDDVANTVTLSIAMGWAVDEAKVLTKSIIDYTAATGLGSEISERIIYNFAQMKQQGKVTGTELRDLGRGAFMPINKVLEIMYEDLKKDNDAIGKTTETFAVFRDEASAGTIDVNRFFTAFNEYVGKNMPDAAYRMNYTFSAVQNNIRDLFKILLGWNVLGPMIQSITKPLQDFIDKMKTDEVLLSANRIGKAMAYLVDSLRVGFSLITSAVGRLFAATGFVMPSVENVVKSIVKLGLAVQRVGMIIGDFIDKYLSPLAIMIRNYLEPSFKSMGDDFFTYGANIIVNFAKGMIQAAAKFLTAAINFIGSILSRFFKANSPPLIAPDIDKWGMNTINEWLRGFTQADFSILDSLKGAVKDALTALVDLGQITDVQSSQLYLHYTVELIRALDEFNRTGKISTDIYDQLQNIGGVYGGEIAKLFGLQLQLAVATEAATQAQKDYDAAIKASAKSEIKTNRLIREYNAMLRKGADKNTLKGKLKLVDAAEIELGVNKKAEIQTKTNLDLAQEQQKVLEDQVKLQESLIKTLTDLAQAQKDLASSSAGAAQDIADAIADAYGGVDFTLSDPTKDWDLSKWFTDATLEFDKWWNTNMPSLSNVWYDNFVSPDSPFQKALANITPSFAGVIASAKLLWDDFAKSLNLPSWDEILSTWTNVPDITTPSTAGPGHDFGGGAEFGGFGNNYAKQTPDVVGRIRAVFQKFSDAIKADGGILNIIKGIGQYLFDKLVSAISGVDYGGGLGAGGPGHSFGGGAEFVPQPIHANIMNLLTAIINDIKTALAPGSQFRTDLGALANQIMTVIADTLFGQQMKEKAKGAGGTASPGQRILDGIGDFLDNSWDELVKIGEKIGAPLIQGIENGIKTKINEKFQNALTSPFGILFTKIAGFFGQDLGTGPFIITDSTVGSNIGSSVVKSLGDSMDKDMAATTAKGGVINTAIGTFINAIGSLLGQDTTGNGKIRSKNTSENPFYSMGRAIIDGIIAGFQSMIDILKTEWNKIINMIPGHLADAWLIRSPSKLFMGFGKNVVQGLALGISGSSYMVKNAMNGMLRNTTFNPSIAMNAPVSAPPVYGGNTVNFNGGVTIANGMDWAMFKAQVNRALVEG